MRSGLLNRCPYCGRNGSLLFSGREYAYCNRCGANVPYYELPSVEEPDEVDIALQKMGNYVKKDTFNAIAGEKHGLIGGIIAFIGRIFGVLFLLAIASMIIEAVGLGGAVGTILHFLGKVLDILFRILAFVFGGLFHIVSAVFSFITGIVSGGVTIAAFLLSVLKWGLIAAVVIVIIIFIMKLFD